MKIYKKTSYNLDSEQNRNLVREAGMVGEFDTDSLRYSYTRELIGVQLEKGFSVKEAQALAWMDLGRGDGRGHYVARIYSKVKA